jgi:hypothetical protein
VGVHWRGGVAKAVCVFSKAARMEGGAAASAHAKVDEALATIATAKQDKAIVEAATALLTKIVANILKSPDEDKFRQLKKTNKQVAASLLPCRGAVALMASLGFRTETIDGVDKLVLTSERLDLDRLEYARGQLASGAVLRAKDAHEQGERAAALQARQTEVLAETAANKRKKMNLKAAAEGDKEARKDPNWKAKAFEKGGKDPARVDCSDGG